MTIANFSVTGYINTGALPELQGSIEGLLYWYEGLANWASLSEVLLLPKDTALYLAGMWRNGGAEPISGHLEIVITRPDGSQLALNDVLNQNNWAAPGNGWMVQFEPVVLDQPGIYKATLRLSAMGQLLDETSMDVAIIQPTAFIYSNVSAVKTFCPTAPAWWYPAFQCRISNPSASIVTRTLTFQIITLPDSKTGGPFSESFNLTLAPRTYQDWVFDNNRPGPGGYIKTAYGGDSHISVWIEDDAGGKSISINLPY